MLHGKNLMRLPLVCSKANCCGKGSPTEALEISWTHIMKHLTGLGGQVATCWIQNLKDASMPSVDLCHNGLLQDVLLA